MYQNRKIKPSRLVFRRNLKILNLECNIISFSQNLNFKLKKGLFFQNKIKIEKPFTVASADRNQPTEETSRWSRSFRSNSTQIVNHCGLQRKKSTNEIVLLLLTTKYTTRVNFECENPKNSKLSNSWPRWSGVWFSILFSSSSSIHLLRLQLRVVYSEP